MRTQNLIIPIIVIMLIPITPVIGGNNIITAQDDVISLNTFSISANAVSDITINSAGTYTYTNEIIQDLLIDVDGDVVIAHSTIELRSISHYRGNLHLENTTFLIDAGFYTYNTYEINLFINNTKFLKTSNTLYPFISTNPNLSIDVVNSTLDLEIDMTSIQYLNISKSHTSYLTLNTINNITIFNSTVRDNLQEFKGGIDISNSNNINILNNTISDFDYSINLASSNDIQLSNNLIFNTSSYAVNSFNSNNLDLTNNFLYSNQTVLWSNSDTLVNISNNTLSNQEAPYNVWVISDKTQISNNKIIVYSPLLLNYNITTLESDGNVIEISDTKFGSQLLGLGFKQFSVSLRNVFANEFQQYSRILVSTSVYDLNLDTLVASLDGEIFEIKNDFTNNLIIQNQWISISILRDGDLSIGAHTLHLWANDTFGNEGEISVEFEVVEDNSVPMFSISDLTFQYLQNLTWTGDYYYWDDNTYFSGIAEGYSFAIEGIDTIDLYSITNNQTQIIITSTELYTPGNYLGSIGIRDVNNNVGFYNFTLEVLPESTQPLIQFDPETNVVVSEENMTVFINYVIDDTNLDRGNVSILLNGSEIFNEYYIIHDGSYVGNTILDLTSFDNSSSSYEMSLIVEDASGNLQIVSFSFENSWSISEINENNTSTDGSLYYSLMWLFMSIPIIAIFKRNR